MNEGMRGIARILLMGKGMGLTKRRVLLSPSVAKEQRQNHSQQGFMGGNDVYQARINFKT
jgi:hypothetical protein